MPEKLSKDHEWTVKDQTIYNMRFNIAIPLRFTDVGGNCFKATELLRFLWKHPREDIRFSAGRGCYPGVPVSHNYIAFDTIPQTERRILDPTYLQFFSDRKMKQSLPPVFIGTRAELTHFFREYKASLRINVSDTDGMVNAIYFNKRTRY